MASVRRPIDGTRVSFFASRDAAQMKSQVASAQAALSALKSARAKPSPSPIRTPPSKRLGGWRRPSPRNSGLVRRLLTRIAVLSPAGGATPATPVGKRSVSDEAVAAEIAKGLAAGGGFFYGGEPAARFSAFSPDAAPAGPETPDSEASASPGDGAARRGASYSGEHALPEALVYGAHEGDDDASLGCGFSDEGALSADRSRYASDVDDGRFSDGGFSDVFGADASESSDIDDDVAEGAAFSFVLPPAPPVDASPSETESDAPDRRKRGVSADYGGAGDETADGATTLLLLSYADVQEVVDAPMACFRPTDGRDDLYEAAYVGCRGDQPGTLPSPLRRRD